MPGEKSGSRGKSARRTREDLERENELLRLENRVLRRELARYRPERDPSEPEPERERKLLDALNAIMDEWRPAFGQERVYRHGRELAMGFVLNCGRNTVTGSIVATGREHKDWSAAYQMFADARVDPAGLFRPLRRRCVERSPTGYFMVAVDDSQLKKTGKRMPGVRLLRDPLSEPYHANLRWAQRFVQVSALIPNGELIGPARAVPVAFRLARSVLKPGKRATEAELASYRVAARRESLGCQAAAVVRSERAELDALSGGSARPMLVAVDGSMANRSFLRNLPERTEFIARVRGDAALYAPAEKPGRRLYGTRLPTPEEYEADEAGWTSVVAHGAGELHSFKVKEIGPVLWRTPTKARPLRLIVIAKLGYRRTPQSKLQYRKPAFLLTSDLHSPLGVLVQAYVHRWEIEVNFREEKTDLGLGKAQVRSEESAERVPAFVTAAYGALLLAAVEAYGPGRTADYVSPPAWRRIEPRRASVADMRASLRVQVWQNGLPPASCYEWDADVEGGTLDLPMRLAVGARN